MKSFPQLICLLFLHWFSLLVFGSQFSWASTPKVLTENEICAVNSIQLDTSIIALDPTLACGAGAQVRLLAGVAQSYQWTRNGTPIPGAINRNFSAQVSGAYRVKVGDGNGNIDSSRIIDVIIAPLPISGFTVNQISQCFTGNYFYFTNNTTIDQGTATYTWYYGDGSFQLSTNGSKTYSSPGSYVVKLVATSNYGCVDSTRLTVSVNTPPSVSFSVNSIAQCLNGNQFFFTNTSTSQNAPLTYRWEFGDGTITTSPNPNHQYSLPNTYSVKLVGTSSVGCRDSVFQSVTVHPKPIVAFTVNNNRQCQAANFFQFTNNSTLSSGAMTHLWRFGDGVESGILNPSHSYIIPATYPVKLIETSDQGCKDSLIINMIVDHSPTALFTVNKTVDCFNEHNFIFTNTSTLGAGTYTSSWDFGDGIGNSIATNPTYRYRNPGTYRVTLNITTNNNCTSSYTTTLFVNANPAGSILPVSDTVICDGSFIELRASVSDFYQWYRNDVAISGATSSIFNATESGVYHVLFRNTNGCTSISTNRVTLTKLYQPTPDFIFDRSCVKLSTLFTNTSDVSSSLPVRYNWIFGDTNTSTIVSPSHTYQVAGTYTVKLLVTPTKCPQLARFIEKSIVIQDSVVGIKYATLNAVSARDLKLQSREFPGARYQWVPSVGLSDATISTPIFNHTAEQRYLINITSSGGCKTTDTLTILLFSAANIFVPDYFTPNGDGLNDKLTPLIVGITRLTSFRIWNRWGQLVFQTQKQGEGWDGNYRGVKQSMETYLWSAEALDIDNKIIRLNGTSVLVR